MAPTALTMFEFGTYALIGGLVLACLSLMVVLWRVRRGVAALRAAAARVAGGRLGERFDVDGPAQVTELARALGAMAEQLSERLSDVARQRNELGAVLGSMIEGVVAFDSEERVLSLNHAAAQLLGLDAARTLGRTVHEAIRNPAVQALVARTLEHQQPAFEEVTLYASPPASSNGHASGNGHGFSRSVGPQPRQVRVQTALLRDAAGRRLGAVAVLHDVTQLRRMEQSQRDFIANVSHEVRTPVAAIKAAAETLISDGERHSEHPATPMTARDAAHVSRFLGIIARQADRLHALVEDLLHLARIENGTDCVAAELAPAPLGPVMRAACEACEPAAAGRGTTLMCNCDTPLGAKIDAAMLEQALVNLIENAVKYSGDAAQIELRAQQVEGEVVVSVSDTGRGIEPQHLPRLFERFYRTDRSRTRGAGGAGGGERGGTGLGLSIVKHAAEAMGGRVSVDSEVGVGSTFRIHLLPAEQGEEAVGSRQ